MGIICFTVSDTQIYTLSSVFNLFNVSWLCSVEFRLEFVVIHCSSRLHQRQRNETAQHISSAKPGLLPLPKDVSGSVCLSVCPSDNWKSCERILTKFLGGDRAWPRDQWVQFWWRSGSLSGSRSPKSEIRIHWIIEKVTNRFWWNFMESWGVA